MIKSTRLMPALLCAITLASFLIAGCMVGPDYHRPNVNTPDSWVGATTRPTTQPTTRTSITIQEPGDLREWWKAFNDRTLDSLVTRAIESNLDLLQAESRIRQARAV